MTLPKVLYHATFDSNSDGIDRNGLITSAPRLWKEVSNRDYVYLAEHPHHAAWWMITWIVEGFMSDQLNVNFPSDMDGVFKSEHDVGLVDLSNAPRINDGITIYEVSIPSRRNLKRGTCNDFIYKGDIDSKNLKFYAHIPSKFLGGLVKRRMKRMYRRFVAESKSCGMYKYQAFSMNDLKRHMHKSREN